MNQEILQETIHQIFAHHKGILAMDESIDTCNKRFASAGIPQTVEMRRKYRELIVTTPGLNESIGGAILSDETIKQQTSDGIPMAEVLMKSGIVPGIKVDKHAKPMAGFPNEKVTEGLDGLRERLEEYQSMGAQFAKWRAVITIGKEIPSPQCIVANSHALCRYAALCQEKNLVPIIEPEVLMKGNHSMQRCYDVTQSVLKNLFYQLYDFKIHLKGIILKPNMVIQGSESKEEQSHEKVAQATVNCLLASVPANVPAIAFLSGGQSPEMATAHLNAIHQIYKNRLPWIVAYSFSRALQQPVLEVWNGKEDNSMKAQKILYHRAKLASLARRGKYSAAME